MPELALPDMFVLRILLCLRGHRKKSLSEITAEYNRYYPPSSIKKTIGICVKEYHVKPILDFLIEKELVRSELFSFTNKPLPNPEKFYSLTCAGTHFLHKRQ
jgi:hypothetical protein